jgi:hypothetical protein
MTMAIDTRPAPKAPENLLADAIAPMSPAATLPRKYYHVGLVLGTPIQRLCVPTRHSGAISLVDRTIVYARNADPTGERASMPIPGAYHRLTTEDIADMKQFISAQVVRWSGEKHDTVGVYNRNRMDFRPSPNQEGGPLDEPLAKYCYCTEVPEGTDGMPKPGGLFALPDFKPITVKEQEAAAKAAEEATKADEEAARADPADAEVRRFQGVQKKARADGIVPAGGSGPHGVRLTSGPG